MKIRINALPNNIEEIKPQELQIIFEAIKRAVEKSMQSDITQNAKRELEDCLLCLYFLKGDHFSFQKLWDEIDIKAYNRNALIRNFFDLKFEALPEKRDLRQYLNDNLNYEELLRANAKYELLSEKFILHKYKKLRANLAKSNFSFLSLQLFILLQLLIDLKYRLVKKDTYLNSFKSLLKQNRKVENFWPSRDVQLNSLNIKLDPVRVMVWDSGVDPEALKQVNKRLSVSYDENCKQVNPLLMNIPENKKEALNYYIGYKALLSGLENDDVKFLRKCLNSWEEKDFESFTDNIHFMNLYCHGTKVASVVCEGHPTLEIVSNRITFDPSPRFPKMYTYERAIREVEMYSEVFNLIKRERIRVVNMSWTYTMEDIEVSLRNNGLQDNTKLESKVKEIFSLLGAAFEEGIRKNPDTLFLTGAGNRNRDIHEEKTLPGSLNLPNLVPVGAVNSKGQKSAFTSTGSGVRWYASGENIKCLGPKGIPFIASGTSFAAPKVANLAAILLSIHPSLTTSALISLIDKHCEANGQPGIRLINPKKTVEAAISRPLAYSLAK